MINNIFEQKAEKLLQTNNYFSVPVDVTGLVKQMNINIEELDLEDDISGFLAIDGQNTYIGCNKSHGHERKRFTIAHELAHSILHAKKESPLFIDKSPKMEPQKLYRNSSSSTGEHIKEIEANAFAAALLMPKKLILEALEETTTESSEELVRTLAEKFQVSTQAMNIRLVNLDVISYNF